MKRDLNLLPRTNKKKISSKKIILTVLGLAIFGIIAYNAIMLPADAVSQGQAVERRLISELEQFGDYNQQYEDLLIQRDEKTFELAALEQSLDLSKNVIGIIRQLDGSRPNGIKISTILYSDLGIDIGGTSDNMDTISEFVVNLRNTGLFGFSNIPSVDADDEEEIYSFNLVLNYIEEVSQDIEGVEEIADEN